MYTFFVYINMNRTFKHKVIKYFVNVLVRSKIFKLNFVCKLYTILLVIIT